MYVSLWYKTVTYSFSINENGKINETFDILFKKVFFTSFSFFILFFHLKTTQPELHFRKSFSTLKPLKRKLLYK